MNKQKKLNFSSIYQFLSYFIQFRERNRENKEPFSEGNVQ